MGKYFSRCPLISAKVGQAERSEQINIPMLIDGQGNTIAADSTGLKTFAHGTFVPSAEHLAQIESARLIIDYAWAATADGYIELYDSTGAAVRATTALLVGGEASEWLAITVTGLVAGNTLVVRANVTVAGAAGEVSRLFRAILQITRASYSVPHNQADVELYQINCPTKGLIKEIQFYCTGIAATASARVKKNGTAITAAITPVAGTPSIVAPTDPFVNQGDALTVHVTTDATGSFTDLTVTIIVKEQEAVTG